jgi:hypothetical protein
VEQPKPARMNRDEFRRWVEEQGGQRFERVAGEPVAMSPERLGHVRLKYRVWQALDAALAEGGLGCEAGATHEGGLDPAGRLAVHHRRRQGAVQGDPFGKDTPIQRCQVHTIRTQFSVRHGNMGSE